MQHRRILLGLLLTVTLFAGLRSSALVAQADPFTGSFSGDVDGVPHRLLVSSDSPGHYDGELLAEDLRLPMVGQRFGEYLMGKIGFPDDAFAIRARVLGAVLLIERQSGPPLRFYRDSD